jgi:hypothetical protein
MQVPKKIRNNAWYKYIGQEVAVGKCYTGCGATIDMLNFECGHIVA